MTVVRSKDMGKISWGGWCSRLINTLAFRRERLLNGETKERSCFDDALRDVVSRMLNMNDDELEIMCQHAIRIDEGRKEYGPLHVDSDVRDMGAEAIEELIDTVNYLTFKLMKMQRGWQ